MYTFLNLAQIQHIYGMNNLVFFLPTISEWGPYKNLRRHDGSCDKWIARMNPEVKKANALGGKILEAPHMKAFKVLITSYKEIMNAPLEVSESNSKKTGANLKADGKP